MLLPLLHGSASGSFWTSWYLNPPVFFGLLAAAIGYGLALRQIKRSGHRMPPNWQPYCFYTGLLIVAISLLGPFDTFNDELFLMHMSQHLLLMQIAAPLLLLGRPAQIILRAISPRHSGPVIKKVVRPRPVRLLLTVMTAPLVVTLLFNGNMMFWHIPDLYIAALESDLVHEIEHMTFLGFSLLFWWPIIEPIPRHHKMKPIWALGSVFISMLVGIALGSIITLADSVLYDYYLGSAQVWGINPLEDQQYGGLIMWVGGGLVYLVVLFVMLISIMGTGDDPQAQPAESAADRPETPSPITEPA
jgi:cytochrome c oxidase assembly factor CtaG